MLEILDAGINVIGAFNIQHLESLNDLVERVTQVKTRETVPDSFLREADQIVNLDLAVEDLLERLKGGKIYAADKIPWALENFFMNDKLATLRELALREVAESLERTGARNARREAARDGRPTGTGRRHRQGTRARARDGLHVVVPAARGDAAAPGLAPGGAAQHRLVRGLRRDARGGAAPDRRRGAAAPARPTSSARASWAPRWCASRRHDPVAALLDFARSHGVGQIVLGRSHEPLVAPGRRPHGGRAHARARARSFDVYVTARDEEPER